MTLSLDVSVGAAWTVLGIGLVAVHRRRAVGLLLLTTGVAWLLGSAFPVLNLLHRGPLIHLLVGYPHGRPANRLQQAVIAVGYLDMVQQIGRIHWLTAGLALVVTGSTIAGYRRAAGAERRAKLTSTVVCTVLQGIPAVAAVGWIAGTVVDVNLIYEIAMLAAGAAVFADARWGRWNRAAITGLVIDLGRSDGTVTVRDKLARALSDPALELGFFDPATGRMIDEAGREIRPSVLAAGRQRTRLGRDGRDIAVITHPIGTLDDQALLGSVTALTGLAADNARLQAAVLSRVVEVESSRRRILEVADSERQSLEVELRCGAERRLADLEPLIDPTDQEVAGLLRSSRQSLRDFARGIHPRSLAAGGLAAACAELARTTPVPVAVDVPAIRLPADLEMCLYFVCAEALTNVVKYAAATQVRVRLTEVDDHIRLTISDDGRGGASRGNSGIVTGTGLRGLADRLAVVGGTLSVSSPPRLGTTVTAEVSAGRG